MLLACQKEKKKKRQAAITHSTSILLLLWETKLAPRVPGVPPFGKDLPVKLVGRGDFSAVGYLFQRRAECSSCKRQEKNLSSRGPDLHAEHAPTQLPHSSCFQNTHKFLPFQAGLRKDTTSKGWAPSCNSSVKTHSSLTIVHTILIIMLILLCTSCWHFFPQKSSRQN